MTDLITVIIPVYNGAKYIIQTLVSVQQQTYTNLECIVVDDGSTDDTAIVVKQWMEADKRFSYVYQSNIGLSGARNTGLDHAKGRFIQFLDADDVLLPIKIERQLTFIRQDDNGIVFSYTDYLTGLSSNIYKPAKFYTSSQFYSKDYVSELITRWETYLIIPPHAFLFSANIFNEKGIRFDTSLPNHEDFDCWLTIISQLQPDVKYINEKLCIYRVTEGSMSKKMKLMGEGFLQVLNKHLNSGNYSKAVQNLLIRKKRAVLGSYRRFDLMTWKDKILSVNIFRKYYSKRIMQKIGLLK
jgi:glycosyltransferase involved in cell wall biosynthesis